MNRKAADWEDEFREAGRAAFEHDHRELLALIHGARKKARQQKATVDWFKVGDEAAAYYKEAGPEHWRETFVPVIGGVIEAQGELMKNAFGFKFDVPNVRSLEWFNDYTLQFAQPINQTSSDGISDLMQQAQKEGWTIPQMEDHLGQMFDQWMNGDGTSQDWEWYAQRLPAHRLEMIARTESMRASNFGNNQLMADWGVEKKEWLATADNRTRDTHIQAWVDYGEGNGIPIDQPFLVGGSELMYPGDPAGPPEETINCRCTEIPAIDSSEINDSAFHEGLIAESANDFSTQYEAPAGVMANPDKVAALNDLSGRFFGKELSLDEWAALSGASRGETVEIVPSRGDGKVYLYVNNGDVIESLERIVYLDQNGNPVIKNELFRLQDSAQGQGLGTEIFNNQIQAAQRGGIAYFETTAEGSASDKHFNGYYTWARLGYDAELSESFKHDLPAELSGATSISDLMQSAAGRSYWRENGSTFDGVFDLQQGSLSTTVFNQYMTEKGLKMTRRETRGKSKGDKNQPPKLNADDERTLDRVWDNIALHGSKPTNNVYGAKS